MSGECDHFMLFSGSRYYASGGWEDFKGRFPSVEDAKSWVLKNETDPIDNWCHVVYRDKVVLCGHGKERGDWSEWEWETVCDWRGL